MNERIEELAEGCFEYIEGTLDGDIVEFNYKKFAELIVRECGRVYIQNQQDGVMTLTQDLLQHFGVE